MEKLEIMDNGCDVPGCITDNVKQGFKLLFLKDEDRLRHLLA